MEQWGSAQAITYIDEFEKIAKLLAENPESGTERPEFFDGLRSFPFNSHSLYFIKQADGITIIRILHQRMDPAGQVHKKFEP
ncbi:type II toxin-antitoxin system RelE/ParE family toxin [Alkalimonas cellulosilytica]|uniref:type II toxin-antitoxin system RelE/ParE family toxin n=1 Tax=Alkalimonas cellulosilytica TaxID=3058395 RepID=UPI0038B3B4CF